MSKDFAAQSFGVTEMIGHLGLCFATFLAVRPLCVKTIIKLALTSKEALTAQLEIVSSVDHSSLTGSCGFASLAL